MARRSSSIGAGLLVVLGLVLFARRGSAGGKKTKAVTANLTGAKVDPQRSWTGSTKSWATTRYAAALAEVAKRWSGQLDAGAAHDVALSLLTHWSIETGSGASEWNFNVGNITAYGNQTYYLLKDISGYVLAFRAFDELAAGVAAYVELLATKYAKAAYVLAQSPASSDWYIALGKAGWFDPTQAKPASTWEAAADLFTNRRALLATLVS